MIDPIVPSWLPAVSLILGALLGGAIGYLLGLIKLDHERELNQRRRDAMRRHAISRSTNSGTKQQPQPERERTK